MNINYQFETFTMEYSNVTIKKQDGNWFNLERRVKRHQVTLLQKLSEVRDGRSRQGKRHALVNILGMVFGAMSAGYTTIKDVVAWAYANERFLRRVLELEHGIPHATTISYALQVCDLESLIAAYIAWREIIFGTLIDRSASFDGKTMKGVHGEDTIRHILSLLTHETLMTIGQVGVTRKENEIPAAQRLFDQVPASLLVGLTLVGDALHTQTTTADAITQHDAYYLLVVKDNQETLRKDLSEYFTQTPDTCDTASQIQSGHGAVIITTVTISHDADMLAYLASDWNAISTIGRLHRRGTRTVRKNMQPVDETVYFIASTPYLTAKTALSLVRNHWKIENNLHWQKDYTYLEDRQTVRLGNAPQLMTFMRSMCINLFALMKCASVTTTIRRFQMNTQIHHDFLQMAAVV